MCSVEVQRIASTYFIARLFLGEFPFKVEKHKFEY